MKRLKKGMTLLVTTVALSFVTIVSAAFSGIYFRYGQMNTGFYDDDREKILLRNEANDAFKTFLEDKEVTSLEGRTANIRTGHIAGLIKDQSVRLTLTYSIKNTDFVATFVLIDDMNYTLRLLISSNNNTLHSLVEKDGDYSLHFEKFVPRG